MGQAQTRMASQVGDSDTSIPTAESTAATVSGCSLQGASVSGYLLAEGLTDAEGVKSASSTVTVDRNGIRSTVGRSGGNGNG